MLELETKQRKRK